MHALRASHRSPRPRAVTPAPDTSMLVMEALTRTPSANAVKPASLMSTPLAWRRWSSKTAKTPPERNMIHSESASGTVFSLLAWSEWSLSPADMDDASKDHVFLPHWLLLTTSEESAGCPERPSKKVLQPEGRNFSVRGLVRGLAGKCSDDLCSSYGCHNDDGACDRRERNEVKRRQPPTLSPPGRTTRFRGG